MNCTDYEETNCAICLGSFSKKMKILPCKHTFDLECIDEWLQTEYDAGKSLSCPFCRRITTAVQYMKNERMVTEKIDVLKERWDKAEKRLSALQMAPPMGPIYPMQLPNNFAGWADEDGGLQLLCEHCQEYYEAEDHLEHETVCQGIIGDVILSTET